MRRHPSGVATSVAMAALAALAGGCGAPGAQAARHPGATVPPPSTSPITVPGSTTPTTAGRRRWPGSLFTRGDVANWPLDASSVEFVHDIVNDYTTDYGTVGVGQVPIYTVPAGQPGVSMLVQPGCNNFLASTGPTVPIPPYAQLIGTSDSPLVIFQPSTGSDWEFWQAQKQSNGTYTACWGGRLDAYDSSGVFAHPYGESATGISYLATAITETDVSSGSIDHAVALQVPRCSGFVYPANRGDCGYDPGEPPEGQWFRLPASLVMPPGLTPFAQMVFRALQKYGAVITDQAGDVSLVAEQASDWYAQGNTGPDPITESWAGEPEYRVVANIPWSQLQAVEPPGG